MKNKKILIAISGGVDSIFLLNFLEEQFEKKELIKNFIIGHFNHNLRGKESDEDETFVKKISEEKGIKFFSAKAEKNLIKSEDDARKFRYEFLKQIAEKEKCDLIAVAHHKDDQIETLFLQMMRGTANFSPMKEFGEFSDLLSVKIWRPLLDFEKKDILDFAKKNNLEWREDFTNGENIFTRNKIRNEIFPELKKINKNFGNNLLNISKISGENFFYLEKILLEKIKIFLEGEKNFSKNFSPDKKIFLDYEKIFLEQKNFSKIFFDKLDISLKKILIKKFFDDEKIFSKNYSSKNILEVIEMIEKGEGKKQKHGFCLEKGKIYFKKIN